MPISHRQFKSVLKFHWLFLSCWLLFSREEPESNCWNCACESPKAPEKQEIWLSIAKETSMDAAFLAAFLQRRSWLFSFLLSITYLNIKILLDCQCFSLICLLHCPFCISEWEKKITVINASCTRCSVFVFPAELSDLYMLNHGSLWNLRLLCVRSLSIWKNRMSGGEMMHNGQVNISQWLMSGWTGEKTSRASDSPQLCGGIFLAFDARWWWMADCIYTVDSLVMVRKTSVFHDVAEFVVVQAYVCEKHK